MLSKEFKDFQTAKINPLSCGGGLLRKACNLLGGGGLLENSKDDKNSLNLKINSKENSQNPLNPCHIKQRDPADWVA